MGRHPSSGGPAFRFTQTEVAEMETILQEHHNQMPVREILMSLADKFSESAERKGKIVVQFKQIWNWFQNRRYAIRAKSNKVPGKLNITSMPRDDSNPMRNVPQPVAAPVPPHMTAPMPASTGAGRNLSESYMEFEAKSSRDGAWYDVATFLAHRYLDAGDPEVQVRIAGFGPEEDEWVNIRKHVRQRSLPCEASECVAVLPGDLVLCFQEGKDQALYFDAHVLDAQRRRHDIRGCRCRFLVRYDHDQSEEIVPLRKVCRRPETDYRLQQLHTASNLSNDQHKTSTDQSTAPAPKIIGSSTEAMQKLQNPDQSRTATDSHFNVSVAAQTTNQESKISGIVTTDARNHSTKRRMRGRSDGGQKKRLITSLCAVAIFLGFLYVYYGSIFGSSSNGASALEYGGKSLRKIGSSYLGGDDESSTKSGLEDGDVVVPKTFPVCDDRHSELIPCLDRNIIYQMRLKLDLSVMEHYERHCPPPERRYNCLIPPPPGYKVPIKWPQSRDEVWKANIPHTHLAHEKSDQNWMVVKGEKIVFPGGGTHFHYGADKYIASIANMLNFSHNNLNNEGRVRTVLDVGCGVASFGAYLLSSDIIAMSLAPNDVHQNQIQFALERGIPACLGVLGTKRLPYPSRSFELAHCSRCRIDWLQRDGILLLELDRLLRPGGYFAYSSPEAYAQDEEDLRIWKEMSALVERMCWRIAAKRNQTVIWQKPLTNDCYMERAPGTNPPLCRSDDDPDAVWGVPMEACITPYSDHDQKAKGSGLAPWPARLTSPPPRLADFGYSNEMFEIDTETWRQRVENYWNLLSPKIEANTLRNLMDMKANMGSFAAALKERNVWVMNVIPEDGPNTLKLIYDRGLIGTTHNWCEAFSTYPRTYDLLHAWTVFSDIEKKGCSAEDLLLEMDRILRPKGFIIIRDKQPVIDFVRKYLSALHWEAVATADSSSDSEHEGDNVVFIVQKKLWLTSESILNSE